MNKSITPATAAALLLRSGALKTEAEDLAPIMHLALDGKHTRLTLEDARAWLNDWREDRRATARNIRADRERRLAAGYRGIPVADPVYIGCGLTEW